MKDEGEGSMVEGRKGPFDASPSTHGPIVPSPSSLILLPSSFAIVLPIEALTLLILFLALVAIAGIPLWRALGGKKRPARPRPGPIPVPPEEVETVEGPVWACMRCGSTEVGLGSVMQGSIPGAGDQFLYVCRRCRHRGPPLEFETTTAYRQFVKGLNEGKED